jgi:hypothetical protein
MNNFLFGVLKYNFVLIGSSWDFEVFILNIKNLPAGKGKIWDSYI